MRNIVLKFLGTDPHLVEVFTMCIEELTAKAGKRNSLTFTFVLSRGLMSKCRQVDGISYEDIGGFVESRYPTYTLANRVLAGIEKPKWYETALNFLCIKNNISLNGEALLGKMLSARKRAKVEAIKKSEAFARRSRKNCTILFQSTYNPCDGYGSSAEAMALRAAKLDPCFRWVPFHSVGDADAHAQPGTRALLDASKGYLPPDHYFLYHTPNMLPEAYKRAKKDGATLSLMTMFETTSVPYIWPTRINQWFDQLIVPSPFCKKLFEGEGVTVPVHVVPLGVDLARWEYIERAPPTDRPFRFLIFANARWDCPRKNFDVVVDAFTERFGCREDVELVIKSSPGQGERRKGFSKNVRIINARLPQREIVDLLHNVDCLVFPSSGEGFGLPPREAMATGLPVIVTNWGGLKEIARSDIAFVLEPSGMKDASHLCDWLASEPGGMDLGQMANVSVSSLGDIMEKVFYDQEGACRIGRAGYEYIVNNETYDHSIDKLYKVLYKDKKAPTLREPLVEVTVKIKINSIRKRRNIRYIKFEVENDSKAPLVAPKSLFVRFQSILLEDGTVIPDPEWGRFELPKEVAPGQKFTGQIKFDISEVGKFTGALGVVNTGVAWLSTEGVIVG